jgi:hypothetical protein
MKLQFATGFLALAMAAALPAVTPAQDNPTTSQDSGKAQANPTQSVTGCLQKGTSADTFTLTSSDGTAWRVRAGKGVDLAAHVGHTITATGTVPQNKNGSSGMSGDSGSGNRLHVRSVQMVSESCDNKSQ